MSQGNKRNTIIVILGAILIFGLLVLVATLTTNTKPVLETASESLNCFDRPAPAVYCVWQGDYHFELSAQNLKSDHSLLLSEFRGIPQFELNGHLLKFKYSAALDQNFKSSAPIQIDLPNFNLDEQNHLKVTVQSKAIMGPYPGLLMILKTKEAQDLASTLTLISTELVDLANGLLFGLAILAIFMATVSYRRDVYLIYSIAAIMLLAPSLLRPIISETADTYITVVNYFLGVSGALWCPMILSAWHRKVPNWLWLICISIPTTMYVLLFTVDNRNLVYLATMCAWSGNITLTSYAILKIFTDRPPEKLAAQFWLTLVIVPALYLAWILLINEQDYFVQAPMNSSIYICIVILMSALLGFRFLLDFVAVSTHEKNLSLAVTQAKADVRHEQQIAQKHQMALATELERRRIMAELHDGTASFFLGIAAIARQYPTQPASSKILGLAENGLTDLRHTVDSLEETAASFLGCLDLFKERIESLLDYSQFSLNWREPRHRIDHAIDPTTSLNVTRIMQELINNAMHHSTGDQIDVEITYVDPHTRKICISDNGTNAPKNLGSVSHAGIRNMLKRAQICGGTLTFQRTATGGLAGCLQLTFETTKTNP